MTTKFEKKKLLKAENKLLRDNLMRMSANVNVLIEKMNQESLKKKTIPRPNHSIMYGQSEDSMSIAASQGAILKLDKSGR